MKRKRCPRCKSSIGVSRLAHGREERICSDPWCTWRMVYGSDGKPICENPADLVPDAGKKPPWLVAKGAT